jgi:hypothetical protein
MGCGGGVGCSGTTHSVVPEEALHGAANSLLTSYGSVSERCIVIEKTPWYLRLLGYPEFRRWINNTQAYVYAETGYWEYMRWKE